MIERIVYFLPSIAILGAIAIATFLFIRITRGRLGRENIRNKEWIKAHRWRHTLLIYVPIACILGPIVEELYFHGPLIIIFKEISIYAWIGIILTSLIFGILHHKFSIEKYIENLADNGLLERGSLKNSKRTEIIIRLTKILIAFGYGCAVGYFGIKYQSLYFCAAIHMLWNLLSPIILLILTVLATVIALLGTMVFFLCREKLDDSELAILKLRWRWRKWRKRKKETRVWRLKGARSIANCHHFEFLSTDCPRTALISENLLHLGNLRSNFS